MGKGYHFNAPTDRAASNAARTFATSVSRRFRRTARWMATTRTLGGRYIATVDVCGPQSEKIDALARTIQGKLQ